jgi:hypothetical protein
VSGLASVCQKDFDGSFLYCRRFYRSNRGEAGGQGWNLMGKAVTAKLAE